MLLTLVGVLIYLPPTSIAVFFAILVLVATWEWGQLAGLSSLISKALFTVASALLMLTVAWYCQLASESINSTRVRDILGAACLWWGIALLWVKTYPGSAVLWGAVMIRVLMGFFTLVPAWLAIAYLSFQEHSTALILTLIAIVVSADSGAYFIGKAWGRSKLAPKVSPNKSWAGFWGGLACSSVLALLAWSVLPLSITLGQVLAVAVVTSLASVLGDLLESMVKRQQGVKDSGVMLPGHGGMMDRLDSLSAASPVFALCLILIGW